LENLFVRKWIRLLGIPLLGAGLEKAPQKINIPGCYIPQGKPIWFEGHGFEAVPFQNQNKIV